jgi:hypothetical protein|uniref:Uncharacterized protein ycf33 n=2 Tax=Heterosigma akashiwo TaxID=2829 RepID=B2XT91_HETAK|nr:conserved hypothetical plastid protein Ycf33 [Heterosigma akashiwo]ABV65989.1 conserved hypothetical plastid protein Ycf33 [Heterosigma akashiwo]ABV70130.1 conserved hypothetical plastid protein Ycf33 [Heterosigma akashiwo]
MTSFWENVFRYPRFFISTVIGLLTIIVNPIIYIYKESNNKIITFLFAGCLVTGISFILKLMIDY